jgi:hypothetical protein
VDLPAGPLNVLAREWLDWMVWDSDEESAAFLQLDGQRRRLDFNQSVSPSDLQLSARF